MMTAGPSFQYGISANLVQSRRGIPDVSWNAAVNGGVLVYVTFPGVRPGWHIVGGTSASTPQIAGLIAMANQLRADSSKGSLGNVNPALYTLSADFTDIVPQHFGSGDAYVNLDTNAVYGSGVAGMDTTTGWDLTTGFGSPKAYSFVHDLAALP